MDALQPSQIVAGKYRLLERLGEGGMGEVWIAENRILEKRVALKVMRAECASDAGASERFLREASVASRVRHPAIVDVHDAGIDGGMPWMAMELLPGETLAARIARRPLTVPELRTHILPILDALAAIHDAGIVHRDLKPDNVFLESASDGTIQPKLLDFGIAKQLGVSRLTKTGELIGTGHYLSPEQARGARDLDARSDLYSMGVVLYEALTGTTPYEAETLAVLIAKLFTEAPRPLRSLAPSVPEPIAALVHRCLSREAAARPHDARVLREMLARALTPADARALPPTQRMSSLPPPLPPRAAPVAWGMPHEPAPAQMHRRGPAPAPMPALSPIDIAPLSVGSWRVPWHYAFLCFAVIFFATPIACGILQSSLAMWRVAALTAPPPRRAASHPPATRAPAPTTVRVREPEPTPPPVTTADVTTPVVIEPPRVHTTTPHVQAGELTVTGGLSETAVRSGVRRLLAGMESDARATARRHPIGGRIVIEVTIGPSGEPSRARFAGGNTGDPLLDVELLNRLRHAHFRAATVPTIASVALVVS